ncbi:MAG: DNA polymerase III subunit gamma/tau [Bacteroidales bacterium]|nr:DNA polymerase III subunit gamma/tau [Bacteroidales bacterium]
MENYLVSARKYRPDSFETVVGQSALTTTLKNAVKNNQLAHAYLFCGPRGVGKTTCARIFAKTINCQHPTADGEACNACESCLSFNEQRSLNIFELDAASNNSVDGIRTLVDQVRIPPQLGKYKVYIIDEVHMLSTAAFNAFLKTLEEPPHHAIFILATTEKHKIIPTILSRCQIHDFNRISVNDIVDQLKRIAKAEGTEAEEEALNVIAVKADGGMRDALSIFDQVASYGNGTITYQHTIENLNVLDYDYYFKLTDALLEGNVNQSLLIFNDILNHGFEGQHFITGLSSHFRDLLVCRDKATLVLLEVGASIRERYLEQAQHCQPDFLYVAIKFCNDADLAYRESKNKRLLVELALIRIAQLSESKKKIWEFLIEDEPAPILPLNPGLQAQAVAQATSPTPTAKTKKSAVAAPAAATQDESDSTNKTANQVQPAKNLSEYRSVRSIRINRQKAAEQREASQNAFQPSVMDAVYTDEAVQKTWLKYSDQLSDDIHLANGMKTCQPVKVEQHHYEVVVSNPVLQKKLLDNKGAIEAWLHVNLRNSHIKYSVKLDETSAQSRPYTNRDRFEHMVKKNPAMLEFYKQFGLDLD